MCLDKDDSCGGWDDVYAAIKESIKKTNNVKEEIEPDLTEAEYEIISMNRCEEGLEKWMMSEEDTIYENVSDDTATYRYTCSYDQNTSIKLQTARNHSINLGLGLGGGGSGVNAGGSFGYGYNRSTTRGNFSDQGESKQSSVEFQIKMNQAVVVKEVTYR